jgi:hypothetical protein
LVENLESIGCDQTLVIRSKDIWCLEFSVENTIPQDFLHHLLLRGLSISTTNVVGSGDLGNWFAIFKLRALNSKCLSLIWGTGLSNNVSILCKVGVHVWPTSLAALSQVVAVKKELG